MMRNGFIRGCPAGLTSKYGPSSWMASALNFRYGIPLGKNGFAQSQQVRVVWSTCSESFSLFPSIMKIKCPCWFILFRVVGCPRLFTGIISLRVVQKHLLSFLRLVAMQLTTEEQWGYCWSTM